MGHGSAATDPAIVTIGPLIDTLRALARLLEAESEALAASHAPDALGTLAATKARLLSDLDRLGAGLTAADLDSDALARAVAALHDAILVHTQVIRPMLKKNRRSGPIGRTRV